MAAALACPDRLNCWTSATLRPKTHAVQFGHCLSRTLPLRRMTGSHAIYHEDEVTSPEMVRPVLHIIGILLAVLGIGMLVPALADAAIGHTDWVIFVTSSAVTVGAAG